jgi:regulator-associated protein of mTOR
MQSCQVDLVHFLNSPDIHAEQRAMAAFVLAVIVDGHQHGQQACLEADLISICLSHIQATPNASDGQTEPLLLQWLCLCLGKLWDGAVKGVSIAFLEDAPAILGKVLSEPQPEVSADIFEEKYMLKPRNLYFLWKCHLTNLVLGTLKRCIQIVLFERLS